RAVDGPQILDARQQVLDGLAMAAALAGELVDDALVVLGRDAVLAPQVVDVAPGGAAQKQRAQGDAIALLLEAILGGAGDVGVKELAVGDLELGQDLLVILIGDVELLAHLIDDAQLGAGEHAFAEELANGVGVDAQADLLLLFLLLLLALDDVKRFAQVLG